MASAAPPKLVALQVPPTPLTAALFDYQPTGASVFGLAAVRCATRPGRCGRLTARDDRSGRAKPAPESVMCSDLSRYRPGRGQTVDADLMCGQRDAEPVGGSPRPAASGGYQSRRWLALQVSSGSARSAITWRSCPITDSHTSSRSPDLSPREVGRRLAAVSDAQRGSW
jgi:hypothetical protein